MPEPLLSRYVAYNAWANKRMCDMADLLSIDKLDTTIASSFPSVRKTLFHIWDAETIWLHRLQGKLLSNLPGKNHTGSNKDFLIPFTTNSEAFYTFVCEQSPDFFHKSVSYCTLDGKEYSNTAEDIIQHCMNHSAVHRGQIITLLRQLGITELKSTDYIAYCRMQKR